MVKLDELEKLLMTHWTSFIDPQKLIAFILTTVRDTELEIKTNIPIQQKKALKITISSFRFAQDGLFTIWVEFFIPKNAGTAIGTCELKFDPLIGTITHVQTIGNLIK